MKKSLLPILLALISLVFTNCASSYKSIKPTSLSYGNIYSDSLVSFSYQYGALRLLGNKKYAKKEDKKGIKVVAVKITNHSDEPVTFNKDLKIYSGSAQIVPLDPLLVHKQLKQKVAIYLLYSPLTFLRLYFYSTDQYGYTSVNSSIPVGYVLGPGLVIRNMAVAGTANKKLLEDLARYNLIGRQIKPGETVYGLIGVQDFNYNPLSIKPGSATVLKDGF